MSWPDDPSSATSSAVSEDELFVFGYTCKIFRDDEKAKWIDEDKHLIPWMGDSELLIDRYDGRGALMDLQNYEAPPGGADYLEGLTPEELHIEQLCEEQRFRDYNENEEFNETSGHEAEFQRLQMAVNEMSGQIGGGETSNTKEYGSVGYIYTDSTMSIGPEPKKVIQEELPYSQPPTLHIPPEILHPLTMKSHAIIEKTAKFIASQGTQMEIILKTKQAKNTQFDFLSHNDPLNPYYKYLVYAIKSNLYKPPDEIPFAGDSSSNGGSDSENNENSSDGDDEDYLHPSLITKSSDINKFIPRVNLKPSTNCAYSMLVSKIKEVSNEPAPPAQNNNPPQSTSPHHNDQIPGSTAALEADTFTQNYRFNSMPQPQEQLIIEKMANYVVKNGPDFETMARTKGDPRFAFLDTDHEHNWYYTSCKDRYMLEANAVVAAKGFVSYKESGTPSAIPQTSLTIESSTNANLPPSSNVSASTSTDSTVTSVVTTTTSMTDSCNAEDVRKQKNNYAIHHSKVRTKDTLQKGRNEKEKIIKISASLPNFAAVLRQQSIDEDSENSCDNNKEKVNNVVVGSACEQIKSSATTDSSLETFDYDIDGESKVNVDDEKTRRLKLERRRKAALFLQRLKKTRTDS